MLRLPWNRGLQQNALDMCAKRKAHEPWHEDARQAVKVLRDGGLLLHATDTVWGLACDATNDDAVQRLNQLKSDTLNILCSCWWPMRVM